MPPKNQLESAKYNSLQKNITQIRKSIPKENISDRNKLITIRTNIRNNNKLTKKELSTLKNLYEKYEDTLEKEGETKQNLKNLLDSIHDHEADKIQEQTAVRIATKLPRIYVHMVEEMNLNIDVHDSRKW